MVCVGRIFVDPTLSTTHHGSRTHFPIIYVPVGRSQGLNLDLVDTLDHTGCSINDTKKEKNGKHGQKGEKRSRVAMNGFQVGHLLIISGSIMQVFI